MLYINYKFTCKTLKLPSDLRINLVFCVLNYQINLKTKTLNSEFVKKYILVEQNEMTVPKPRNFEHSRHMKENPSNGFALENLLSRPKITEF